MEITTSLNSAQSKDEIRNAIRESYPEHEIQSIVRDTDSEVWRVVLAAREKLHHRLSEFPLKPMGPDPTEEDDEEEEPTDEEKPKGPPKEKSEDSEESDEKGEGKPAEEGETKEEDPMAKAQKLVTELESLLPKLKEIVGLPKEGEESNLGDEDLLGDKVPLMPPEMGPPRMGPGGPPRMGPPRGPGGPPGSQPAPRGPALPPPPVRRRRTAPPTPPLNTFTRVSPPIHLERVARAEDTEVKIREELALAYPTCSVREIKRNGSKWTVILDPPMNG